MGRITKVDYNYDYDGLKIRNMIMIMITRLKKKRIMITIICDSKFELLLIFGGIMITIKIVYFLILL